MEVALSSEGDEDAIVLDTENAATFRTICGGSTFWIPEMEPETIYLLDNNAPTLQVPQFVSYSEQCEMATYELYSDETQLSTDFSQDFVLLEDEDKVQFTIIEDEDYKNKKASYTYQVRGSGITESEEYVLDP